MPRQDVPPITRAVVLRLFVLIFSVALAGLAGWLIVTGKTQKRLELGVLAGLWSALLGGFALYGARRSTQHDAETPISSTELELRSGRTELERAEEAAARRAHEARLEQLLRAEVQAAITREVSSLRAEIADLRGELLEKVGNQVRLERIETTRVIGSDLEALQQEVRQLQAVTREVGDTRPPVAEPAALRPIVEPARVRPVSREAAEVQAEVQPAVRERVVEPILEREPEPLPVQQPEPEPEPVRPAPTVDWAAGQPAAAESAAVRPSPTVDWTTSRPEPEPPRATPPSEITGPIRIETPRPVPAPEPPRPSPAPVAERASDADDDPLSGLPRIEPFTAFELDPIETTEDEPSFSDPVQSEPAYPEPAYTGRRRRREDGEPIGGRHSRAEGPGRRHRDEDDNNDLLARLLARESR